MQKGLEFRVVYFFRFGALQGLGQTRMLGLTSASRLFGSGSRSIKSGGHVTCASCSLQWQLKKPAGASAIQGLMNKGRRVLHFWAFCEFSVLRV